MSRRQRPSLIVVGLLALFAFIGAIVLVALFTAVWPISEPVWVSPSNPFVGPAHGALALMLTTYGVTGAGILAAALVVFASFGGRQTRFHAAFLPALTLLIVTFWCTRYTMLDARWSAGTGVTELGGGDSDSINWRLLAVILVIIVGAISSVLLYIAALWLDREPPVKQGRVR